MKEGIPTKEGAYWVYIPDFWKNLWAIELDSNGSIIPNWGSWECEPEIEKEWITHYIPIDKPGLPMEATQ